jgi:hypothetical protein
MFNRNLVFATSVLALASLAFTPSVNANGCPKGMIATDNNNRNLKFQETDDYNQYYIDGSISWFCMKLPYWDKHLESGNDVMDYVKFQVLSYANKTSQMNSFSASNNYVRVEAKNREYSNDKSCVFYDLKMIEKESRTVFGTGSAGACYTDWQWVPILR